MFWFDCPCIHSTEGLLGMCGCGTPVSYTGSDDQFWQQMTFLYDLFHHHCSCTLLMVFSLGQINASDNELTFSIIIVLDISPQTPCKNNHCMLKLRRLKKTTGVHYLNISRNEEGYFQLKSKHHCTTNINSQFLIRKNSYDFRVLNYYDWIF